MSAAPARRVLAIWLGPSLVLVLLSALVTSHYRMPAAEATRAESRGALLQCLRSGLLGNPEEAPASASLQTALDDALIVRVYNRGRLAARFSLKATTHAEACHMAREEMGEHVGLRALPLAAKKLSVIQVDRVSARAPLLQSPGMLASLAVHPALDGVGVRVDGADFFLLPSETIDSNLLSSNRPLKFVPDFVFGFDNHRADELLRTQSGKKADAWASTTKEYFRFRSESFVEAAGRKEGLVLTRGQAPPPELSEEALRAGALDGGHYLVSHMAANGRYIYLANMATGRQSNPAQGGYSLPRHAGTTYFLAELYRITRAPFLLEPIERAIGHMADLVVAGGCAGTTPEGTAFVCVSDRGQATSDLGSTALAVVALAEYKRATGSSRFEGMMNEMAEFLLYMQREDGSFAHRYNLRTHTIDQETELLYYSGEASLALARMHLVTGEARYLQATEAALDWLVAWYDFFLGSFFYGEEHWTCIAAEAISDSLYKEEYWEFCSGYGKFLRSHQPESGEFADQQDWAGAYYFTPFLAPQNTPAGSRTEAMISTYLLGARQGHVDSRLWQQIMDAMRFSLSQQLRPDGLYRVPPGVKGLGGVSGSPIDRSVRIDYVQHVCSAMIRSAEILRKSAHGEKPPKSDRIH